jgi:hypothetical protein
MHFNNPIPRTGLPHFAEQSSQQSLRESGSTGHLWKKAAKTTAQESANTRALQQIQRKVEKLRRRVIGGGAFPITTVLKQCHITALYGNATHSANYFQVINWNNNSNSGSTFYSAKSVPSRMVGNSVFYGTSYTYTYTDDNHRVSTSNADNSVEAQVMTQPFTVNDVVYVIATDYSGVNAPNNGGDIKYIEHNTEREWTVQDPSTL